MYYFDLYGSSNLRNRREIIIRLIQMLGTVYSLLVLIYYLYSPMELSRRIFVIVLVFTALLLLLWRELFLMINRVPEFSARTLILGDSSMGQSLMREFALRREPGMRVVGRLDTLESKQERPVQPSNDDRTERLLNSVKYYGPDHIVVALGERRGCLPVDTLLQLKSEGISIHDSAELYEAITGMISLDAFRLSWLLFSPDFRVSSRVVPRQNPARL
jgi:FlaA1/EpsC-like NDP-sugar epimerase